MKKTILLLLIFFAFSAKLSSATSHKTIGDSIHIVIGITITDATAIESFRLQLESTENIKVLGYCSNFNVFIIESSLTQFGDEDLLFKYLQKMSGNTMLFRKTGAPKDIIKDCVFTGEKNEETLKSLLQ